MISYQVIEHGQPLQKVLASTPKPQGSEVLVRVTRAGVCHSDLHIWEGFFDLGGGKRFYVKDRGCVPPFTLGHEPLGVVEALGPKAKGVKVGQKRLVYPWIGCGKCDVCKAGQENHCISGTRYLGVNRAGAYSTHLLVPDPKYLIDIGGIDDSFAATLACSALTAYSAANKLPDMGPKDEVAVLGCGGLGLIGISVLREKGVKGIVACDVDDMKLAAAMKLGAKRSVNTRSFNALQQMQGIAGALDFVGAPATAALGIGALRKGGRYVICGLFGGELVHPLPPIAQRAIGIIGSYVGNLQELKEIVALAKKKKLKPMPVQTRPGGEASAALEDLKAGRVVGRIVLDFEAVAA
ncbi:MAG: alcohol dehydrogenase catalytic domain-containing protein [Betaproteobacteria bacterium]|nr:alcohol dehydrogenase catalytic domain-containing protein [Betaproteobacteria bacterium]MBV9359884.1 alcohol dehydrogenase catalytic domain-containing protein [Betaproteobacteria bacterium]